MIRKGCFFALVVFTLAAQTVYAADRLAVPGISASIVPAAGWSRVPGTGFVLHRPAATLNETPRLTVAATEADPASAARNLREGYLRVADGAEVIDDDRIPIGGRVWHRLRLRFAAGPLVFGQASWIGTVGGRTIAVVLSGPDDDLAALLPAATAMVGSLNPD